MPSNQIEEAAGYGKGPVNCNVARRREKPEAPYPRSCERCGLGPCPFYDRSDASPDGYERKPRYADNKGNLVAAPYEAPPEPKDAYTPSGPERMGYTAGPTDLPTMTIAGPGPNVGKRPVQPSTEAIRAAFEIALVAAMRDQGLTFAKVSPRPETEGLPSYEHVVEAVQNHTNRTLTILRTVPRELWDKHEADSIATLKGDFDRLGFGHLIDFPR